MSLNKYEKICYRQFGRVAENLVSDKLKMDLEKAHIEMRASVYLSVVWFNTILAALITSFVYITLVIFFQPNIIFTLLLIMIPVLGTIISYIYFMTMPSGKAKSRAKKIDTHLPYALNFISAMSSAGITPTAIFESLSKQDIYGEIQQESLWIYRDVSLLGRDIISAIKSNIQRTPSEKFKEFLQGAVVTVQSGGSLKAYFMSKADQYTRENRIVQKQLIESLGIMAEAYVTAAVAGVLLIIIILPLLMVMSNVNQMPFMYAFVFLVIPMIHIAFALFLSTSSEKV